MPPRTQPPRWHPKNWTVSDIFAALSFLVAALTFIYARQQAAVTEASRVETATVTSNRNVVGGAWQPWQASASEIIKYVGLSRRVTFRREFSDTPRVSTALGLINVYPTSDVLSELGFKAPRVEIPFRGVKELHVVSFAGDTTAKDFEVRVGIGLPTEAAMFLGGVLQQRKPPQELIDRMFRAGYLLGNPNALTPQETWMVNFYSLVGTIDVTWIAQR